MAKMKATHTHFLKLVTLTSHRFHNKFNNSTGCENGKISNLKQTKNVKLHKKWELQTVECIVNVNTQQIHYDIGNVLMAMH